MAKNIAHMTDLEFAAHIEAEHAKLAKIKNVVEELRADLNHVQAVLDRVAPHTKKVAMPRRNRRPMIDVLACALWLP